MKYTGINKTKLQECTCGPKDQPGVAENIGTSRQFWRIRDFQGIRRMGFGCRGKTEVFPDVPRGEEV